MNGRTPGRRRGEEGGLLIVLMVGVAVMMIGVAVAAQAWSVTWRRDSEEELIFRGGQYVDAILAYRKDHNGQFPVNLEDLMEEGPRQVRYIRRLFKDPVNPGGQWGLLYLMPTGNAIYDPVAAQRATDDPQSEQGSATMAGITPINMDPTGTGIVTPGGGPLAMPGMPGAAGPGAVGAGGIRGATPGAIGGVGGLQRASGAGALRSLGGGQQRSRAGLGAAGAAGFGALPPPKPKGSSFDEDSPSEPPIGWPIVGVISRAEGAINENTFKIYKGFELVNEWQFHVFDRGLDTAAPPVATAPGGSPPPFIGPGFGGKGPLGGIGGGPQGRGRPGMFPGGGRQQGGKQPGDWRTNPPPPPGGRRND